MHGARDDLLSGARLAKDQNRQVVRGETRDRAINRLHGRCAANEPVAVRLGRRIFCRGFGAPL